MPPAAHRWPSFSLAVLLASAACSAETPPPPSQQPKAPAPPASAQPSEPAPEPPTATQRMPEQPRATPAASQPLAAAPEPAPAPARPPARPPTATPPPVQAQAPASIAAKAPAKPEPSRAAADAMSVAELVARRDLWPTKVAFKQLARLDEMTYWKEGEELPLHAWNAVNVGLDEGTFLFEWPAENTDVVERARALAAALPPEALALTVAKLVERPELWPVHVKLSVSLQFGGGVIVPAGREVALRFFEGQDLAVYDREVANYYTVAANETDVMARARERLSLPEAERTPFFVRSLEAALDPAAKVDLAGADYVLVYSGRLGCMRCASFAPRLKEFYQRAHAAAPAGARFELVFLSNDPNAEAAQKYLAEAQLPGGVIAFDQRLAAANLMTLPLRTLPGFYVFDRAGNLVDRNHPDAGAPSADDVLAKFEARVKAPR